MLGLNFFYGYKTSDQRLDDIIEHYKEGRIGFLQFYVGTDITEREIQLVREKIPDGLEVVIHMAHLYHDVNIALGFTKQVEKAIELAEQAADIFEADYVIAHAGGLPHGSDLESNLQNQRICQVMERLSKMKSKVLIENPPQGDRKRDVYMASSTKNWFDEKRVKYGLGFCLDFAHLCPSVTNIETGVPIQRPNRLVVGPSNLPDYYLAHILNWAFDSVYYSEVKFFLQKEPEVLHISGCYRGDTRDIHLPLTEFNWHQLIIGACYNQTHNAPIIIETPPNQWELEYDIHNLGMAIGAMAASNAFPTDLDKCLRNIYVIVDQQKRKLQEYIDH